MKEKAPEGLTFTPSYGELNPSVATWVKVPNDYTCSECRERGGWMPRVWRSDCPMCYGEDPYGESYCGECQFCCGC